MMFKGISPEVVETVISNFSWDASAETCKELITYVKDPSPDLCVADIFLALCNKLGKHPLGVVGSFFFLPALINAVVEILDTYKSLSAKVAPATCWTLIESVEARMRELTDADIPLCGKVFDKLSDFSTTVGGTKNLRDALFVVVLPICIEAWRSVNA